MNAGLVLVVFLMSFCLLVAFAGAEGDEGAQIFQKKCRMCHGDDGKGGTTMGKKLNILDLGTGQWKQGKTVPELTKTLKEGLGKMPKYEGKLTDAELQAVATFVVKEFVK